MKTTGYKGCTAPIYTKEIIRAANEVGASIDGALAGGLSRKESHARWIAWKALVSRGFSYYSIGRVSGFNHTSVMYACRQGDRGPMQGRKLFGARA